LRTLEGRVDRELFTVGHVGRHGGVACELALHRLDGLSQRVFERRRLLDQFLELLKHLFPPLLRLASEICLPGLVLFTRRRHDHL
jgi:hypothetical protein